MFKKLIRLLAFKRRFFFRIYTKLYKVSGFEYAELLKKYSKIHSIGRDCAIWPYTTITDPEYTRIGNNVMLTACTILGHDGSIAVLNKAYGKKLDKVGKVDIRDNVFVGHGAIVLPNVTIGPNAIVAAGAVVTKDVPENSIVAGVPARVIGSLSEHVEKLEAETKTLPWYEIINAREGGFDAKLEPILKEKRVNFFFKNKS